MPSQFERALVLKAYPKKVPIWGAHGDINRMLKDRGKREIYEEEDEWHHMDKTRDEYHSVIRSLYATYGLSF